MAQRRGKSQAKRSGGTGLPGWAWLVIGIALTLLVVLAAPKLFKPGSDGFFKPTPNPDAQPQPVDDEAVVEADVDAPATDEDTKPATGNDGRSTNYDFYTLLPGKEVPLTDAEIAASEQAEQQRAAEAAQAPPSTPPADTAPPRPVPAPVQDPADPTEATTSEPPEPPDAPTPAVDADADAGARYILQAGAFEASGQAEELKARIAMLGLGARVESAQIKCKTVYRVRMGPYGTAGELAEAKRKLASGGLSGMAVKVN